MSELDPPVQSAQTDQDQAPEWLTRDNVRLLIDHAYEEHVDIQLTSDQWEWMIKAFGQGSTHDWQTNFRPWATMPPIGPRVVICMTVEESTPYKLEMLS